HDGRAAARLREHDLPRWHRGELRGRPGHGRQKSQIPALRDMAGLQRGVVNILLASSDDEGQSWTAPIQVNDNTVAVDEFQPNLDVAPDGTVSVAFYDRRLACPAAGTAEAAASGLALDTINANYSGALPPYGAT